MPRPLIQAIGKPVDLLRHVGRPDFWVSAKFTDRMTLDASLLCSAVGDMSGNERDLSASGTEPTWSKNSLNGLPGLVFSGSERLDGTSDALWDNTTGISVFAVIDDSGAASDVIVGQLHVGNNERQWLLHTDRFQTQDNPASNSSTFYATGSAVSTPQILAGSWIPSSAPQLWRNGSVIATASAACADMSGTPENLRLGSRTDAFPEPLSGTIGEIVIYSKSLIPKHRVLIERYLDAEWRLGLY